MIDNMCEYSQKWSESAEILLEEGVYEWAAEPFDRYEKVLEIGCGTGQSTFVMAAMDHKVFAIDKNPYCIIKCKDYIENSGYSVREIQLTDRIDYGDTDVTLLKLDALEVDFRFLSYLDPDNIVLWNPGGWNSTSNTIQNAKNVQEGLIKTIIRFAGNKGIPFSMLNRFITVKEANVFWECVQKYAKKYVLQKKDFMSVKMPKDKGVQLISEDNGRKVEDVIYTFGFFVGT